MQQWSENGFREGAGRPIDEEIVRSQFAEFYFDLYTRHWAQAGMREILASIPSIAMWDDHDIIDGWGSYPPGLQQSQMFKHLWPVARKAFATFQQQVETGEQRPGAIAPNYGFSLGYKVGGVAIVAIDMRSERTQDRILSRSHWDQVYSWMRENSPGLQHVLIMSSIPVVYPGFATLESLLGRLPGQQDLEDDLRDHWNSPDHKGERLRLIHNLLALAAASSVRVTIISGDVHVAAQGVIESTRDPASGAASVINQLISSGIVHPSPPAIILFALRRLLDNIDEVDRGIVARMVDLPGTQSRFIGGRNFLSLEPDEIGNPVRIWANWHVEGSPRPYVKVIHSTQ
jgi:hypothetical protein